MSGTIFEALISLKENVCEMNLLVPCLHIEAKLTKVQNYNGGDNGCKTLSIRGLWKQGRLHLDV